MDNGKNRGRPQPQLARRRLLKGVSIVSGALAVSGGCPVPAAVQRPSSFSPGTLDPDTRRERQPFYGLHQAGIIIPQQAAMMLVSFDVLAGDKDELIRLFKLLTHRIAFLTRGGKVPASDNPQMPPLDSGILGDEIYPDNLTITVSVGAGLFDERFGLQQQKPSSLVLMTRFPHDALDAKLCHGDLLLQICANTNDTVIHALRDIIKNTPDLLSVRWRREGFFSDHAARSRGKETPVNLLGFKDGTANPDTHDGSLMDNILWVSAVQKEPAWTAGGSYQAVRII
ncbi:deferrochelatase/peroxidase EfeB [Izhakiella capsodis]|uniref:Deferrochelatase/peroxidase EfeB n=1 Tax=Izhakiella capsodis TaxID=1367852 RepID=A0A1I5ANP9_9GAMM|nr:deferrochelatase/peroxidase EfeB [Izhakiella capsodis]